jgi:hypothetical protein
MGRLSEKEDAWQAEATANAVADARSITQSQGHLANTPAGRLSDQQWGWIISAAIFAWIRTRYQQAVAEGLAQEEHVTRMDPSPCDSATVLSILPMLADQSPIDWSKPLTDWSREEMADFVGLASRLIDEAKAALARVPDAILHKPAGDLSDGIPF